MRRILKSAVVLGVVSLAGVGALNAQGAGRASFHVAGGVTLPMGDFGDFFGMGWQGLGGVMFGLGNGQIGLRVDGFYGQNGGDEDVVGPDVKAKFFGGMAGAQFNFGQGAASAIKPYVLGQVGMVNSKVSGPGGSTDGETDLAFGGGAGINFGLGSMGAFVEGMYVSVQTEGSSSNYIAARFGVRFGGGTAM